jgi:hypothetical protein
MAMRRMWRGAASRRHGAWLSCCACGMNIRLACQPAFQCPFALDDIFTPFMNLAEAVGMNLPGCVAGRPATSRTGCRHNPGVFRRFRATVHESPSEDTYEFGDRVIRGPLLTGLLVSFHDTVSALTAPPLSLSPAQRNRCGHSVGRRPVSAQRTLSSSRRNSPQGTLQKLPHRRTRPEHVVSRCICGLDAAIAEADS